MAEIEKNESMYPELTFSMKRLGYLDDRSQVITKAHQAIEEIIIDLSLIWQGEIVHNFLKDRIQNSIPTYLFMHRNIEELVTIYQENQELRSFLEEIYFRFNLRTTFFENRRQILLEEITHGLVPFNVHDHTSLIHETIRTRYPTRTELKDMLSNSHWLFTIAILQLIRPIVISLFMYNQQQLANTLVNTGVR